MKELKDKVLATQDTLSQIERDAKKTPPARSTKRRSAAVLLVEDIVVLDEEVAESSDAADNIIEEGESFQCDIEEEEDDAVALSKLEVTHTDEEEEQETFEDNEERLGQESDSDWEPPELKVKVDMEGVEEDDVKPGPSDASAAPEKKWKRRVKEYPYDDKLAKLDVLRCHHCPETFERYGELNRHCSAQHKCLPKIICCNRHFQKAHLADHMRYHEDKTLFRCKLCHKDYMSGYLLKNHESNKHQLGDSKWNCKICGHKFRAPHFLTLHMISHQERSARVKYRCEQCPKVFTYESSLKGHVQRIHDNNLTEICDICGKGFATKWILNAHQRYHERQVTTEQCDICLKYFSSIKSHKKRVHGNEMMECKECGKNLSATYYRTHMKEYHMPREEIPCTVCGKIFWNKKNFRVHMGLHQGVKYPCRFCTMDFGILGNRTKHEKARHLEMWVQLKEAEEMDKQRPPIPAE